MNHKVRCPQCNHEFAVRIDENRHKQANGTKVSCPKCKSKSQVLGDGVYYLAPISEKPAKQKNFEFKSPFSHFFSTLTLTVITAALYYAFSVASGWTALILLALTVLFGLMTIGFGYDEKRSRVFYGIVIVALGLHFTVLNPLVTNYKKDILDRQTIQVLYAPMVGDVIWIYTPDYDGFDETNVDYPYQFAEIIEVDDNNVSYCFSEKAYNVEGSKQALSANDITYHDYINHSPKDHFSSRFKDGGVRLAYRKDE